jgi:hypothetical protein
MKMHYLKLAGAAVLALILTGCAHPLQINPAITKIERPADAKPRIKANVAYLVNEARRAEERVTPGGGGDKVATMPYRDIETAFYKMLTNVYDNVTTVKSVDDKEALAKAGAQFIIAPTVTPGSSSSSMLTWPPTAFTIDLVCDISAVDGGVLATKRVIGQGNAEFGEFKSDFARAGRRAMEDALLQMQHQLLDTPLPAKQAP